MDEQLINEYINNLANQVNNLTQENILLKTRLSLLEKREQERMTAEEKVKESFTKEVPTQPAPKSEYSTPPEEQPKPQVEQIVPKKPDFVKGPKPKGYNPKVDGPRPLIPNPKIAEE